MFQGAKVPGSELARVLLELLLQVANWPGSEKARYQKIPCTLHRVCNLGSLALTTEGTSCVVLDCSHSSSWWCLTA